MVFCLKSYDLRLELKLVYLVKHKLLIANFINKKYMDSPACLSISTYLSFEDWHGKLMIYVFLNLQF